MLEQESSYHGDMTMSKQHVVALTSQTHRQQKVCFDKSERQYEATMPIPMLRESENGILETSDTYGIDCASDVPLAAADEIAQTIATFVLHNENCD